MPDACTISRMPYTIREDPGLVRVNMTGARTAVELHAMLTDTDAMLRDRPVWPDNLFDMRGMEAAELGFTEVLSLARRREAVTPPNPIRTAFVAEAPSMVGYVRMFQHLNHNPLITSRIFSTVEDAE